MPTKIEWTQGDDGVAGETWNVVRGCSRVSPGCGGARGEGGCYAERQAIRQSGPGGAYEGLVRVGKQGPRWTGKVILVPDKLLEPLTWRKPRRCFVNSMSDLFHEALTNEQIAAVFGVMAAATAHTFQILTKRGKRMREWFQWVEATATASGTTPAKVCVEQACRSFGGETQDPIADRIMAAAVGQTLHHLGDVASWPLPNVWMGVSAENEDYAEERIPELLSIPAAVRFVSYEPALGPIIFWAFLKSAERDAFSGVVLPPMLSSKPGLDWIIIGGESGPGSRPFNVEWARSVVQECEEAKVACFVKQLGRRPETADGRPMLLVSRKGNDMEEWPEDLRVRQWPRQRQAEAAS